MPFLVKFNSYIFHKAIDLTLFVYYVCYTGILQTKEILKGKQL